MNVLQVLPAMETGGVERGTLEIARELVKHGHGSFVLSDDGKLVEQLEREGSQHIQMTVGKKSLFTFFKVFAIPKLFEQYNIDIVHVRSRLPAWVIYLAWRLLSKAKRPKLITTVHGLYTVNGYSAVMTKGEYLIAVSKTIQGYIETNYPKADRQRIVLIHRGVDGLEFPYRYHPNTQWIQEWQSQYPQLRDRFIVVLPGRITRLKGHLDFVKIISALKHLQMPVAGLVVGGVHPKKIQYLEEVKAEVEKLSLQEDIYFLGNRSDIREVMSMSAVILSLSNKPESFGRTTLEAIKLGIPVVAYDHGGVGEILADTFPEGLVPLGDRQAVETKLFEFYKNRPEVKATDLYQLQTMLNKTMELYERVVNE